MLNGTGYLTTGTVQNIQADCSGEATEKESGRPVCSAPQVAEAKRLKPRPTRFVLSLYRLHVDRYPRLVAQSSEPSGPVWMKSNCGRPWRSSMRG